MTEREKLNYVAGLVDGEGCIMIAKQGNRFTLRVTITNTDFSLLESIKNDLRIGEIYLMRHKKKTRKFKIYRYLVTSFQALLVLKKLFLFLRGKKEEAILGIKFQENKIKFRDLNHTKRLPQEIISVREELYQRMRVLKGTRKVKIKEVT